MFTLIVKPDATPAEIAQATESDNPQIFAQSVRRNYGFLGQDIGHEVRSSIYAI